MAIDRPAVLRQAEKLLRLGKLDQAIAEYVRLVDDQPQDWTTANALGDLYVRAGYVDQAVEHFTRIADGLNREGFRPKAGALYKKILKLKPDDEHAMMQSAEIAAAAGLLADARAQFNAVAKRRRDRGDEAGAVRIVVRLGRLDPDDEHARLAAARARLDLGERDGALTDLLALADHLVENERHEPALRALAEALRLEPESAPIQIRVIRTTLQAGDVDAALTHLTPALLFGEPGLLASLAVERPEVAFTAVQRAADAATSRQDWAAGAEAFRAFLRHAPHHVPASTRLVELALESGLEDLIVASQSQLAEALLATGSLVEGRHIAEDLLAKAEASNFRPPPAAAEVPPLPRAEPPAPSPAPPKPVGATPVAPPASSGADDHRPLQPADLKRPAPEARQRSKGAEIDLTVTLEDIRKPHVATEPAPPEPLPDDIEAVFARLRDEASARSAAEAAAQDFLRGSAFAQCGDLENALAPLKAAARSLQFRFEAAAALGRLFLSRGETGPAIDWLERAAEAPPPSPDAAHMLLYDLAAALESTGETARALAVCLELQADAPDFRDLPAQVTRLVKLQAHE